MAETRYKMGEPVVFRVTKCSSHPGPRAESIHPAPRGENYTYEVDKYWTVKEILADGTLRICTRRGKEHLIDPADPKLRPARWWERLFYRSAFPKLENVPA